MSCAIEISGDVLTPCGVHVFISSATPFIRLFPPRSMGLAGRDIQKGVMQPARPVSTQRGRPTHSRGGTGGPGKKHAPARNAPADAATLNLTTIYRDHGQFIWLSLQRFGVHLPDLDDLAHDVFMVVHRKVSRLDPRGPIRPWLFGICMRVAANYRRRRRWKVEIPSSGRDHNRAAGLPLADDLLIKGKTASSRNESSPPWRLASGRSSSCSRSKSCPARRSPNS